MATTDGESASMGKARGLDAVLTTGAFLAAAPSLYYPLGRDQGLYYYIGREWFERGSLPYRDTFDIKTPGVYMVQALAVALFGEHAWGFRLLEIVGVVGLGWAAAALASPPGQRPRPGAYGATAFATSLVYFSLFDFWNAGQCEIWCVLSVVLACLATRMRSRAWAAALSGVGFGAALVFKTPAMTFAPVILGYLLVRHWAWDGDRADVRTRSSWLVRDLVLWGAGVCAVVAALLAYFAKHDALGAMYELLVVNMRVYVLHGRQVFSVGDFARSYLRALVGFGPYLLGVASALYVAFSRRREDRRPDTLWRLAAPVLCLAAAVVAVTMQLKFFWYHWGLVMAFMATGAGAAVEALGGVPSLRRRGWGPAVAMAAGTFALFLCARDTGATRDVGYVRSVESALLRATGRLSERDYLKAYDYSEGYAFSAPLSYEIGQWLRDNTRPDDAVAVRSMEPQIYQIAGRHHTGRFFWSTFLEFDGWSYRVKDWLEEDRQVFQNDPPRYVVAGAYIHTGPVSVEYFLPLGYRPIHSFGGWDVLERVVRP